MRAPLRSERSIDQRQGGREPALRTGDTRTGTSAMSSDRHSTLPLPGTATPWWRRDPGESPLRAQFTQTATGAEGMPLAMTSSWLAPDSCVAGTSKWVDTRPFDATAMLL